LGTRQIGHERALRVGGDGGDRAGRRSEAESVQRQRCRFFSARGHVKKSSGCNASPAIS